MNAPKEIWAFWTPNDFDDDAVITAYETIQHGAQHYIRADLHKNVCKALEVARNEIASAFAHFGFSEQDSNTIRQIDAALEASQTR